MLVTVQKLCQDKHRPCDPMPSQQWPLNSVYTDMSFHRGSVFIVEHYLHSQSYLIYQNDFRSAFPKSQVQDESTVFCSVAPFRETGSVSDQNHSVCHAL